METFEIRDNLLYSKSHEWVEFLDDGTAKMGLSDFAQHALSDLVFVEMPKKGRATTVGKSFGNVESVKAVSPIYSQVTGVVEEINKTVDKSPELINEDPYGSWIIKVSDITDKADLMDAAAYAKYSEEQYEEIFGEE